MVLRPGRSSSIHISLTRGWSWGVTLQEKDTTSRGSTVKRKNSAVINLP